MEGMDVILLALALLGFFLVALPIAVAILFSRVRQLTLRLDGLQRELRNLRPGESARPASAAIGAPAADAPSAAEPVPPRREAAANAAPPVRPEPAAVTVAATPAEPHAAAIGTPPQEAATVPPAFPKAERPRSREAESLETAIGTRWLLYIGVIAIVIGAAYFEKLAIDYGWIGEGARVIQGTVVGLALMVIGARFGKRGYAFYGQVVTGGGGAILYLSTYAAFNFYSLIERPLAFTLMVAITVLVAWLADRHRSQGLALMAVGGGFATPFLLPGTTDAQVALFTYDAILIAGTAVLSHRRDWPILHLVSYVFTLLTVAGWADRFYTPAKYLRTEVYVTLYCGMFVYIAHECRRASTDAGKVVGLLLWTAPLAYYFASLAILIDHDTALLVWLVSVMLTGGVVSSRVGPGVGLGVWFAVLVPLLVWCTNEAAARHMLREGLTALTAVYAIALLTELEATIVRDEPRAPGPADIAWVHLNPLVVFAGVYMLLWMVNVDASGRVAAGFAVWNALVAVALWRRHAVLAVHFLAVALTLAAIAITLTWSGTAVTAGWAVEGALVIMLGIRQRLTWLRTAGIVLFVIAVAQTLAVLTTTAPASDVLVFNTRTACASLVVGLCYLLAWFDWRDSAVPARTIGFGAALLTAQLVSLVALSSEINAYWARQNGHLQQELTLSVAWGLYATVLVVIGLSRDYAPLRYFAIGVLAITIGKVFFVDMAELDRIYRVGSVVGLGIVLLVTSYLYSRSKQPIDDRNGRL